MAYRVSHLFSDSDLDRIKGAVHEAEKTTSGEIVPFIVDRSDDYEEAEWRAGTAAGGLFLLVVTAEHLISNSWVPFDFAIVLLLAFVAFLGGIVLAKFVPPVKRFFAGQMLLSRRVALRASQAFLDEEVFNTRDRSGILLFLSALEHRVIVLGDKGINASVKPSEWQEVVDALTSAIRKGNAAEGFLDAIARCGSLLQRPGLARKKDDADELSGDLRVRER